MNLWDVLAPTVRLNFSTNLSTTPDFIAALLKVPGVKDKRHYWLVPMNAVEAVEQICADHAIEIRSASWEKAPGKRPTPKDEIFAALKKAGEVKDFVIEDFLTAYQWEALSFGWGLSGVHFWHSTGAGKTLTGIVCGLSQPGTMLILTRAASRIQYAREVERFTNLRAYVVRPSSQLRKNSKRLEDYLEECKREQRRAVIVCGWENLVINEKVLIEAGIGPMICDEAHRAKNSKRFDVISLPDLSENEAERNKQIKQDQDLAKQKDGFIKDTEDGRKMFVPHVSLATSAANVARYAKKRIATTATPIKDRVRDLYAQLDLVEPNAWGSTTAWQDRYCDRKPGIYGGFDTTGQSNIDELNARIAHVAHVLDYRQTHRGLPPKRRQSVYIPPEEQCKPSAGFAAQLKEAAKRGPGAILEAQLARSASMKRKSVLSLIESHVESGQKVVVFTGRKADCDKLGDEVRANQAVKHHNAQVWSAHGETSTKARQEIIDDYMAHPGPCVLVGTGAAFGESLNIHDTDAALFVMLPYDPGQLRQWEGRFCRLGQKRSVIIYYIIAEGTVDEHVANILIDKLPAVEKIVGDVELAEAGPVLAGIDQIDPETFAQSVLDCLDFG